MRYLCVHGHFYQPPRENPSLEAIELQDSAYPYHDWNERVTAECYAPNGWSRILNDKQEITEIMNNYASMSFNFGPTLLSWIQQKAPKVYATVLQADQQSQERFGGHGSAIAQGYNHMILPLANRRDKITQVKWGMADFESRFQRKPEGMWLPETAVNTETLEVLAGNGIRFTILAPRQAKRVRRKDGRKWVDVTGDRIDPSRAYEVRLPSKKSITTFFYDGPISRAVAFEGLLGSGQRFAERLLSGFSEARTWPQMVHIATDGESYGHHHHYGEMALSYALRDIENQQKAQLTNYGQFLELCPPDHYAEVVEHSSWSCVHGVERWRANCGCNSGGHGGWNQEWRAPLRASMDWLRDSLAALYEEQGKELLKDAWSARDAYIQVILDRSEGSLAAFFAQHATHQLSSEERVKTLKLLEMQRHALLMYTSCGWFFDELSGIETVQVIHYAARALRLAEECTGRSFEPQFMQQLGAARSNLPEHGNGAKIYENFVRPAYVSMDKVAGHYAISSLFENYGPQAQIYCYQVDRSDLAIESEGKLRMATGKARFGSDITLEADEFSFAVMHLGDHNLLAGVRATDPEKDQELRTRLEELFTRADTAEIVRLMDEAFSHQTFSLQSLFRDEQRRITTQIVKGSLTSIAMAYRSMYETNAPLIRLLHGLSVPTPPPLQSAAEFALNTQLREAFEKPAPDVDSTRGLFREAANSQVKIDRTTLEFAIRKRLESEAERFAEDPDSPENVRRFKKWLDLALTVPFPVIFWQTQRIAYTPLLQALRASRDAGENGAATKKELLDDLFALQDGLKIHGVCARHATP